MGGPGPWLCFWQRVCNGLCAGGAGCAQRRVRWGAARSNSLSGAVCTGRARSGVCARSTACVQAGGRACAWQVACAQKGLCGGGVRRLVPGGGWGERATGLCTGTGGGGGVRITGCARGRGATGCGRGGRAHRGCAPGGGRAQRVVRGGGGGCFSFGVQTSGEYISTMFGCI